MYQIFHIYQIKNLYTKHFENIYIQQLATLVVGQMTGPLIVSARPKTNK